MHNLSVSKGALQSVSPSDDSAMGNPSLQERKRDQLEQLTMALWAISNKQRTRMGASSRSSVLGLECGVKNAAPAPGYTITAKAVF